MMEINTGEKYYDGLQATGRTERDLELPNALCTGGMRYLWCCHQLC